MKNINLLMLLGIVALAVGFASCSDDDDDNDSKTSKIVGYWKMDGSPIDLKSMMKARGMNKVEIDYDMDDILNPNTRYISEYYVFSKDGSFQMILAQYDTDMELLEVGVNNGTYSTTSDVVTVNLQGVGVSDPAKFSVKGNKLTITYEDEEEDENLVFNRVQESEVKPLLEWTPTFKELE